MRGVSWREKFPYHFKKNKKPRDIDKGRRRYTHTYTTEVNAEVRFIGFRLVASDYHPLVRRGGSEGETEEVHHCYHFLSAGHSTQHLREEE